METGRKTSATDTHAVTESDYLRGYSLFVLTLICTANYFDRQVLTLLLEPIRKELSLSDTQVGFLTGIAFTFVNVALSVPVARLADKWSRRNIIAIAVLTWSVMSMLCGAAQSFVQLFLARMGVGAGEAGGTAPCHALTGDLYPRERRNTAIAVLLMSTPLGMALGFLWGGWALAMLGWRKAFVFAGAPGVLLAALVIFTLPDRRAATGERSQGVVGKESLASVASLLWSIKSLRYLTLASMLQTFLLVGITLWVPSFLFRSYGMAPKEIGTGMALVFGLGFGIGTLVGGRLIDVMGRRDVRWHFWIPTVTSALAPVFTLAAFCAPRSSFFMLLAAETVFGSFFASSMTAIAQSLVPVRARATAIACVLVVINVLAIGLGPQLIGILSDALRPSLGNGSLRAALLFCAVLTLPATLCFHLAGRTYASDLARAELNA